MTARTLRGAAAIVGVVDDVSPTGELDRHGRALEAAMVRAALDDAGLDLADVDGVAYAGMATGLAEYLGIRPRYVDGTMVGGSSYELHVEHAAAAIAAGLCDVVVGVYAATPRSRPQAPRRGGGLRRRRPGDDGPQPRRRVRAALRPPAADGRLRAGRQPPHGHLRHDRRAARPASRSTPAGGPPSTPGPATRTRSPSTTCWPRRGWRRRCTCSTAAWSPTAPGPSS